MNVFGTQTPTNPDTVKDLRADAADSKPKNGGDTHNSLDSECKELVSEPNEPGGRHDLDPDPPSDTIDGSQPSEQPTSLELANPDCVSHEEWSASDDGGEPSQDDAHGSETKDGQNMTAALLPGQTPTESNMPTILSSNNASQALQQKSVQETEGPSNFNQHILNHGGNPNDVLKPVSEVGGEIKH